MGGIGTTWRRNIAENFNRLSRVHQRYRRQTDGPIWEFFEGFFNMRFARQDIFHNLTHISEKKLFESLVKILPWMYLCSALWTRSGLALAQVYALRMLLYIFKYKFVGVGTLGKLTVSAHNRQKLAPSRQARCQILFLWRGSRRQATMTMSSVKVPTCTLILHLSFCSIDQIWAASTPPPLPRLLLCRT